MADKYLTNFPLAFASDQQTLTTTDPREQFKVFLECPIFQRIMDPNYGLEEELFLQRNIFSMQEIVQIYMVRLREKFKQYLTNVHITRVTAEFDRNEKAVTLTIWVLINGVEEPVKKTIKDIAT